MAHDQDLCANCGRWREEHYGAGGQWIADRWEDPCLEYQGTTPALERRARKDKELAAVSRAAGGHREFDYGLGKTK